MWSFLRNEPRKLQLRGVMLSRILRSVSTGTCPAIDRRGHVAGAARLVEHLHQDLAFGDFCALTQSTSAGTNNPTRHAGPARTALRLITSTVALQFMIRHLLTIGWNRLN